MTLRFLTFRVNKILTEVEIIYPASVIWFLYRWKVTRLKFYPRCRPELSEVRMKLRSGQEPAARAKRHCENNRNGNVYSKHVPYGFFVILCLSLDLMFIYFVPFIGFDVHLFCAAHWIWCSFILCRSLNLMFIYFVAFIGFDVHLFCAALWIWCSFIADTTLLLTQLISNIYCTDTDKVFSSYFVKFLNPSSY
jgi:hypothetical protein